MLVRKTFWLSFASTLVLTLSAVSALAEHGEDGSYGTVVYEASRLHDTVQYSALGFRVKQAVARFHSMVHQLENCGAAPAQPNAVPVGTFEHGEDGCAMIASQVRRSWSVVERYLYDTYYDYPQVYAEYLQTRNALNRAGI